MNAQLSESGAPTIPATNPETAKRKRPNFRLLEQANEVIAEHEATIASLRAEVCELPALRNMLDGAHVRIGRIPKIMVACFALGLLLGAVIDAAVRAVL